MLKVRRDILTIVEFFHSLSGASLYPMISTAAFIDPIKTGRLVFSALPHYGPKAMARSAAGGRLHWP
jgi:hypothetical protein